MNLSAFLSWCGKDPISDVSIKMIGVFGTFVCSGYFALTGTRDVSKNRHGITSEELENSDDYNEDYNSEIAEDYDVENNGNESTEEININTGLFEGDITDEGY